MSRESDVTRTTVTERPRLLQVTGLSWPATGERAGAAMSTRTENILRVTKRLILMTAGVLAVVAAFFGAALYLHAHFMVSWVCFGCGLLGGFVSIQQRLKKLSDAELALLSQSWFQIILIPVYGG